jgi:voltage-gated potassium channel Kch
MRPFKAFVRAIRGQLHDEAFRATLVLLVGLLVAGTLIYPILEGWSFVDSLYFSVVTLATVGYGDLHPTTDIGKLFTVLYILSGVGVLVVFASRVVNGMVTDRSEGIRQREERYRERHHLGASDADAVTTDTPEGPPTD